MFSHSPAAPPPLSHSHLSDADHALDTVRNASVSYLAAGEETTSPCLHLWDSRNSGHGNPPFLTSNGLTGLDSGCSNASNLTQIGQNFMFREVENGSRSRSDAVEGGSDQLDRLDRAGDHRNGCDCGGSAPRGAGRSVGPRGDTALRLPASGTETPPPPLTLSTLIAQAEAEWGDGR